MTELWLICLALATPIAGVIGFAIQIRTVRKVRLENVKLELEIKKLEKQLEDSKRQIVLATPQEIEKYSDVRFSRGWSGINPGPDEDQPLLESSVLSAIFLYLVFAIIVLFLLYLCFDIFRIVSWVWSLV